MSIADADAVEVQLASIALADIVGRERDYAKQCIRLIWLTGRNYDRVLQLSFADIDNISGSRIFVVDEASKTAATDTLRPLMLSIWTMS